MAEEPISYYPPDLPLEIANIVTGAHTLDVLRLGVKPRPRIVARIKLTVGDEDTPHGKHPDKTDDQIAEEIWAKAEADAKAHCKGFARYKITATYSKPARGTTEEPKSFEVDVGDPPISDERTSQRDELLSESRQRERDKHREYLEVCREVTHLVRAVGSMATGLAGAWSSVHESRAKSTEHALELKILENERDGERERIQIFGKTVVPMLNRLLGGKALPDDGSGYPELVQVARKLGRSFTPEQLDAAKRIMGADRLRELAGVTEAAQVMSIGAWLIANQNTEALYNELREDQAPLVARLQVLITKGGEEHAQQQRAIEGTVG